jgi:Spy/CpxP family protein refolding chaperone
MSSVALPRPAERVAIVSMVLIFLCGVVCGALAMSWTGHGGLHSGRPVAGGFTMSLNEWQKELDLSPEQTRQLDSILDDFGRYYDNLMSDGQSRIRQILNEEQRRKFEKLIAEHRPR